MLERARVGIDGKAKVEGFFKSVVEGTEKVVECKACGKERKQIYSVQV